MDKTKDDVQTEAELAIIANNGKGILELATGVGKSRIPINIAKKEYHPGYRILICVPTEKLRDVNWKNEFIKWGAEDIWNECVERTCYVSMPKLKDQHYDMVVLDEVHNITENNSIFFSQCTYKMLIGLTATMPTESIKRDILKDINLRVVYSVSMDQAVEWKLVSPYKIIIVKANIEMVIKNVPAGNAQKRFFQTEYAAYQYLTNKIESFKGQETLTSQEMGLREMYILKRMHLVHNFQSKLDVAKYLLEKVISKTERTIIFAGSIEHAKQLCVDSFHSKSPKKHDAFERFKDKEINRLSCVNALNEGHNIPDLDNALIVQLNSKSLRMIQRIGRVVRYRPDHIAKIIIIVSRGTVDQDWTNKSLADFDPSNITTVDFERVKLKYL